MGGIGTVCWSHKEC